MCRPFKVTFCGSSYIINSEYIFEKLVETLELVVMPSYVTDRYKYTFYCGGYGEFDGLACKAVDVIRKNHPNLNIEKLFVTPYITPEFKEKIDYVREYYDDVIYPPIEKVPLRLAIVARNRWMIDQSDIVIGYDRSARYTKKNLEYAFKKKKSILYIADSFRVTD